MTYMILFTFVFTAFDLIYKTLVDDEENCPYLTSMKEKNNGD